jgi:hypothetical protein
MSHFTEGVLQAYLDEEVAADARAQVGAHVGGCAECAARLQELRDVNATLGSALAWLDREPLAEAALAELRLRTQQRDWHERIRSARWSWKRAAAIVVCTGALAAAAAPGSPVRAWLVDKWEALRQEPAVAGPGVKEAPVPVVTTPTAAQITPVSGRVRISLQGQPTGTPVHVVLVDAEKATIEASVAAGESPRYRIGAGWLEMVGGSAGEIRIALPRSLTGAPVEVDGRVYVSKQGNELRYTGPEAPAKTGAEVIFKPAH